MELLVSLLISSIIFLSIGFILTENSKQHAHEDIKLDSKVFANYILDEIENTISIGTDVNIEVGTYSSIDEITVTLSGGNVTYNSHAEHGIAKNENKIFNYDNTYDNGKTKYSITELTCEKVTSDTYFPSYPAPSTVLSSSFKLELIIGIYDAAGDELESYKVNRYIFNPYIYTDRS